MPPVPFNTVITVGYVAVKPESELSVAEGEVVLVSDGTSSNDWFYGEVVGASRHGWFPRSCSSVNGSKIVYIKEAYKRTKDSEINVELGEQVLVVDSHGEWVNGRSIFDNSKFGWFPKFCVGDKVPTASIGNNAVRSSHVNKKSKNSLSLPKLSPTSHRESNLGRSRFAISAVSPINSPGARKSSSPVASLNAKRSVSLGGRSSNSSPKRFFGDNDETYKRVAKRLEARSNSSEAWKDVRKSDESLAMALQLEELKKSGKFQNISLKKPNKGMNANSVVASASPPEGPKCIVCNIEQVTVAVAPCWHTCLCSKCSENITHCAKCGTKIVKTQKMFL